MDAHKNFAYSTVAAPPAPAASGTSLTVASGDGAAFPTPPFNAVVWPPGVLALANNAEIVRVTAIAVDTLTIARTQEGTVARTVAAGDQIAAAITAKTLTDIETGAALKAQANTFTAQQTVDATTDALTVRAGRASGYPFKVQDKITGRTGGAPDNQNIVSAYNISVNPQGFAGSIKFHGTNGNPTSDYGAWSLGLDVTSPSVPDRDFYIGKLNTDGTTSDIIYLAHGGASAATVLMFPAGGSHPVNGGVNIWGRTRSASDSPLLALMPTVDLVGPAFGVWQLDDTQPSFTVAKDGGLAWGPGGSGVVDSSLGRSTTDGALFASASKTGAGVQRVLVVNNNKTKANLDGSMIEFEAGFYATGQVESTYLSSIPGGQMRLLVRSGAGQVERVRMDPTNISFNGATPQTRPALPVAAVDAATTQALANAIRSALIGYGLTT